ncbi:MAG: hypothetical protein V7651_08730 [Hyphomonas oceanitis]|uniref:hypothetical protein n=1 Tax=Hyphomonas oceanitis TaxID=81033 RepID=UPI003001D70B
MIAVLKRTPVIWGLFIAQLLIFPCFALFSDAVGGRYLDTITTGEGCRALIAGMTEAQRSAHFWITVLLDTAYPLAYGGFFAAMALRFFGRYGPLAALPALATIIVDLTENTVQALALSGAADALDAKSWLTPLKFGLFFLAAAIALIALVIAVAHLFRQRKA